MRRNLARHKYQDPQAQGRMKVARDTRALTDEVEFFDEPTPEQQRAARHTICLLGDRHGATPVEIGDILRMLGIHPRQADDIMQRPSTPYSTSKFLTTSKVL